MTIFKNEAKNINKRNHLNLDKKNNESINSNTKDLMNQSNSKKRIVNEFYINYMENLFEKDFKTII